uniref:TLC domain-containing protein n=1 Tax=Macrostomum lignano TaxID=282301 RepID=A0A1I8FH60_9PLAT
PNSPLSGKQSPAKVHGGGALSAPASATAAAASESADRPSAAARGGLGVWGSAAEPVCQLGDGTVEAGASMGLRHLSSALPLAPANACTPRSIETFPPDLISTPAKQRGAILLHVCVAVWLFAALAVVCDEYFLLWRRL